MQPITLRNWKLNPVTNRYEAGFDGLDPDYYLIEEGSFGAKATPTQLIVEDFSSYNVDDLLIDANWQEYQTNGGGVVKTYGDPHRQGAKYAYSDWSRGQFATSYRSLPEPTAKAYMAYMYRIINNDSEDYGVIKPNRLTSSLANGGGGVYNGVGCFAFSNIAPQGGANASGQASFTRPNPANLPDNNGQALQMSPSTYQDIDATKWNLIQGFVDLGTVDTADGFFWLDVDNTSYKISSGNQLRYSGRPYLIDTVLLGLDLANPFLWIKINGAVQPNQNYTITAGGNPYTVNSGPTPKTAVQIMEDLYTLLSAVYPTTPGSSGVFLNAAHTQIRLGDPSAGSITHTFTSNLAYDPYGVLVGDLIVDDSRAQFYLCDSATFAGSEKELLIYDYWTTGSVAVLSRFGGRQFDGTKHLHFVDDAGVSHYRGSR